MVAGDRRRPAASSSNAVMTPPRARRRAASIAEESRAEDIALDAQRESRFASVALAAGVLTGPSDLPQRESAARFGLHRKEPMPVALLPGELARSSHRSYGPSFA